MAAKTLRKLLTYCFATIWLVNGMFCKVFNLVPRHQQIVATILGNNNARIFTVLIGLSEIAMAIWIISGRSTRLNAVVQIIIIAVMNLLEFILAPELLLWGKFNSVFACVLIVAIYWNEFHLNKKTGQQT